MENIINNAQWLGGSRWLYDFGTNINGEHVTAELGRSGHGGHSKSVFRLWYKNGYTAKELDNYITVYVYAENAEGNIFQKYNPTHGPNMSHNFDWVMEDTDENRGKILAEIYRRAFEEVRE